MHVTCAKLTCHLTRDIYLEGQKTTESHLTEPDISSSFSPSSSSLWVLLRIDKVTGAHPTPSGLALLSASFPCALHHQKHAQNAERASLGTQNHSDQLVVKITSITLNLFALDMTEGCLQDVTSNTTIADHQVFVTSFPETRKKDCAKPNIWSQILGEILSHRTAKMFP